jgi:hypothetical protein
MTATFQIDQTTPGTPGVARRDLALITPITLHAVDEGSTTYLWEVISYPEGSDYRLINETSRDATLGLDVTGGYLVRLTVDAAIPATKDIAVLYLGVPLANSGLCIPAFNETFFDNATEEAGFSGYERKVTAFLKWVDSVANSALLVELSYKMSCRVAVNFWADEVPAGTLVSHTYTFTNPGSINLLGWDGLSDLIAGDRVLFRYAGEGGYAGIWEIVELGDGATQAVLQRTTDCTLVTQLAKGNMVYVIDGVGLGGTFYQMVTENVSLISIDSAMWEPATDLRIVADQRSVLVQTSRELAAASTYNSSSEYSVLLGGAHTEANAMTGTLVAGYNHQIGTSGAPVLGLALFGMNNILGDGVSQSIIAGSEHDIGADCVGVSVFGQAHTLSVTNNVLINGVSNTVQYASGSIISGRTNNVIGGAEDSLVIGRGNQILLGGCDSSFLLGINHHIEGGSTFNMLVGNTHTLMMGSVGNAIFGTHHDFALGQGNYNLIAGDTHGCTVAHGGGMLGNLIVGLQHSINTGGCQYNALVGSKHILGGVSGGIQYNLLAGEEHSITGPGCTYNGLIGHGHTVSANFGYGIICGRHNTISVTGCDYSVLLGDTLTLGGVGSYYNLVQGASHTLSTITTYSHISGRSHLLEGSGSYSYMAVFGNDHTFSAGSNCSLVVGETHTLTAGNNYCLVSGKSNTLGSGDIYSFIHGLSNTTGGGPTSEHAFIVGNSNTLRGDWNTVIGASNTLPTTGQYAQHSFIVGDSNSAYGEWHVILGASNSLSSNAADYIYNTVRGRYNVINNTRDSAIVGSKNTARNSKGVLVTGVLAQSRNCGFMHINAGGHPSQASAALTNVDAWQYAGGGQNLGMIPHSGITTVGTPTKILYLDGADATLELPFQANCANKFVTHVVAISTTGARTKSWEIRTTILGGNIIGAPQYEVFPSTATGDEADWDVTVTSTGTLYRVTVTGSATETVSWQCLTYGPEVRAAGYNAPAT